MVWKLPYGVLPSAWNQNRGRGTEVENFRVQGFAVSYLYNFTFAEGAFIGCVDYAAEEMRLYDYVIIAFFMPFWKSFLAVFLLFFCTLRSTWTWRYNWMPQTDLMLSYG